MPYATRAELHQYLEQVATDSSKDSVLDAVLARAAALINLELSTPADLTAATTGTQIVYGDGTIYLTPSAPFHTVTGITAPDGYSIPDYALIGNALVIAGSTGVIGRPYYATLGSYDYWPITVAVWSPGVPYTVAATFGYSEAVLTALKEANLQIAVRLWRFKDSGGSEVIGAEDAVIEVRQQFGPMVRDILRLVNREKNVDSVGVY